MTRQTPTVRLASDSQKLMTKAEWEAEAWKRYESAPALYHVSPLDKRFSIEISGLYGTPFNTDGKPNKVIWFFVEKDSAGDVAYSLGHHQFALFEIKKPAIKRKFIKWDDDLEFLPIVGPVCFYCIRKHIGPRHIKPIGCYELSM